MTPKKFSVDPKHHNLNPYFLISSNLEMSTGLIWERYLLLRIKECVDLAMLLQLLQISNLHIYSKEFRLIFQNSRWLIAPRNSGIQVVMEGG